MTHTPGPWWIEQSPQDERWPDLHTNHIMGWFHYPDGREKTRCEVATVDNADSDARLIAASPRLKKALENLLDSVQWLCAEGQIDAGYVPYEDINEARMAIAEAEGSE